MRGQARVGPRRPGRYTDVELLRAYREGGAIISRATAIVGCSRTVYLSRQKKGGRFATLMDEIREEFYDQAEETIRELMNDETDPKVRLEAAKFTLTQLATGRTATSDRDALGGGGSPVNVTIVWDGKIAPIGIGTGDVIDAEVAKAQAKALTPGKAGGG